MHHDFDIESPLHPRRALQAAARELRDLRERYFETTQLFLEQGGPGDASPRLVEHAGLQDADPTLTMVKNLGGPAGLKHQLVGFRERWQVRAGTSERAGAGGWIDAWAKTAVSNSSRDSVLTTASTRMTGNQTRACRVLYFLCCFCRVANGLRARLPALRDQSQRG